MKTNAANIGHLNAMPAPTWNFLGMNDATIEVPEGLEIAPRVKVRVPWHARGAQDAFENALAEAQEAWEETHPEPTPEEIAAAEEFRAAEADATYGGTARSTYQKGADELEEARSLERAFSTGIGAKATALLHYAAGERIVVEAGAGEELDAQVLVEGADGVLSVAAVDVVAYEGATVRLSIVVESPDAEPGSRGMAGTSLRVFAGSGAVVEVVRMQVLDEGFCDVDDMGLFAGDDARLSVSQTVLGAAGAFTGLAADLRGESARLDIDTRYLGHGTQERDFNYIVRHHGPKTECDLKANGVLAGASKKTLRGTIDLIRGAKGAQGSENETVLLVDEDVRNKTIPVILCNEDDVAGNHGATIGHVRDEQLFYLASRGLSKELAERLFVDAMVEQAAIEAFDDEARAGAIRFGERMAPGFAALFEEEG